MMKLVAPVKNPLAASSVTVAASALRLLLHLPNPNQQLHLHHSLKKQEVGSGNRSRSRRWAHHQVSYRAPHRPPSRLAYRRSPHSQSNVNEDTDEMLDDLLEKYGEVVFRRNDQKTPTAEADDDAECLSFAVALAKVANDVKAADVRVLFVKPLVYWTQFFIIATAFSRPQIDAIGSRIRDLAETQYKKVASGDVKPNSWTLLDFGDVVVHIFLPEEREFYNLEEFYGNAIPIELPFDAQSSFHS